MFLRISALLLVYVYIAEEDHLVEAGRGGGGRGGSSGNGGGSRGGGSCGRGFGGSRKRYKGIDRKFDISFICAGY